MTIDSPSGERPLLRDLLEEAWSLEAAEREPWLRQACGEDTALFERVRALLVSVEIPDGFLETPLKGLDEGAGASADAGLQAGMRLGPWRLVEPLGRGGMGVVWRAERDDETFERKVAIKLLHRASAGAELEARFRRECALQASLEHPGIARLVDSGLGPGGRAFMVLEYVEGVPLDEWLAREQPSVRERLELFVRVSEAVHHAHKNLVVHRDLKPANLLVTAQGEPKLLDFGIAKLLMTDDGAMGVDLTREEQRLFTPSYASPEQLRGEPVGIASDVYSLGVLLYELLVGERPFDLGDVSWAERIRIVTEDRPTPPSVVAARLRLTPDSQAISTGLLEGDLDAIVLTALSSEPERRYGSAEAFGDDLERHLDGLPVRARPDTIGYRTSRFLKRHRVSLGMAALALVALLVSFVATIFQYLDAEAARDLAETRLASIQTLANDLEAEREAAVQRAEELGLLSAELGAESERSARRFDDVRRFSTDLVFDVHKLLIALPGSLAARERVLAIGARHLATLGDEATTDPELQLELAGAWLRLGDCSGAPVESNLGDIQGAAEKYERALVIARALYDREGAGRPGVARVLLQALTRTADAEQTLGTATRERELIEAALPVARELSANPAATNADLEACGLALDRLAKLRTNAGELDEAYELVAELQALNDAQVERFGADGRLAAGAVAIAWRAANLESARQNPEAALELNRDALRRAMRLPPSPSNDRMRLVGRARVGLNLRESERFEEALPLYEANVAQLEEQVREASGDARAKLDLAINLGDLALSREGSGLLEPAVEPAMRAFGLAAALVDLDANNQEYSQLLVVKALDATRIATRAEQPDFALQAISTSRDELARRLFERPTWLDLAEASRALSRTLVEILGARFDAQPEVGAEWRELAEVAASSLELHERDPRARGQSTSLELYRELKRLASSEE